MQTLTVMCSGIECEACAGAISRSVGRLAGVDVVTVDISSKKVAVTYDEGVVTPEGIRARLATAGFEAD